VLRESEPVLGQPPPRRSPASTPFCPSLLTDRYSILTGLSLLNPPGGTCDLTARSFTMGDLFQDGGDATAIYGRWHLGKNHRSLPTAHGFDAFHGLPLTTDHRSLIPGHSPLAEYDVLIKK
jgi:arylsulfatase